METSAAGTRLGSFSREWLAIGALVLIFVALLGIWNEIRFQGCVARSDRDLLINATAKHFVTGITACHRLPFVR